MSTQKAKHILLVEDDSFARKIITRMLTEQGFKVTTATGGPHAVELYNAGENNFDAIVSDLVMEEISGGDLAKMNNEDKKLPFVVCSAFTDAKFGLQLFNIGVHSYLIKPVTPEVISTTLNNAIHSSRVSKAVEADQNSFSGNLSCLKIPSKLAELGRANSWLAKAVSPIMDSTQRSHFLNFLGEFLLNAHEHGNLRVGEELKSKLMEDETFDIEVSLRENALEKEIQISICAIKGEVAVEIKDQGEGFDYKKWMGMTQNELVEKIEKLNGRGIFMARHFFDSIEYSDNGATVLVVKKL